MINYITNRNILLNNKIIMKTNIKINKRNLTTKQMDKIIEDENTINLTWKQSTGQRIRARKRARVENRLIRLLTSPVFWAIMVPFFIILVLLSKQVNASDTEQVSIQNSIRMERKEVCWRVQRQLRPELWTDDINRCATVMTLNYAIESKFWQVAVRPNNKLWLKGRQNGSYGFMTFNSEYEARLYWAEKYYTYHYKKSMHTYIYWYKQSDWSWKWWYTATQKDMYYNFFMKRWNTIYNEIENLTY